MRTGLNPFDWRSWNGLGEYGPVGGLTGELYPVPGLANPGLARGLGPVVRLLDRFDTPAGKSTTRPAVPNVARGLAPSPNFGGLAAPPFGRTGLGARLHELGLERANVVVWGVDGAEPELAAIRGRAGLVDASVGERTSAAGAGANADGSTRAFNGLADSESEARFVDEGLRAGPGTARAEGAVEVDVRTRRRPSVIAASPRPALTGVRVGLRAGTSVGRVVGSANVSGGPSRRTPFRGALVREPPLLFSLTGPASGTLATASLCPTCFALAEC